MIYNGQKIEKLTEKKKQTTKVGRLHETVEEHERFRGKNNKGELPHADETTPD